jgi:hypothetical protein
VSRLTYKTSKVSHAVHVDLPGRFDREQSGRHQPKLPCSNTCRCLLVFRTGSQEVVTTRLVQVDICKTERGSRSGFRLMELYFVCHDCWM